MANATTPTANGGKKETAATTAPASSLTLSTPGEAAASPSAAEPGAPVPVGFSGTLVRIDH